MASSGSSRFRQSCKLALPWSFCVAFLQLRLLLSILARVLISSYEAAGVELYVFPYSPQLEASGLRFTR
jgi:hypothetical protein